MQKIQMNLKTICWLIIAFTGSWGIGKKNTSTAVAWSRRIWFQGGHVEICNDNKDVLYLNLNDNNPSVYIYQKSLNLRSILLYVNHSSVKKKSWSLKKEGNGIRPIYIVPDFIWPARQALVFGQWILAVYWKKHNTISMFSAPKCVVLNLEKCPRLLWLW